VLNKQHLLSTILLSLFFLGKLPIQIDIGDAQQVFTTTALELAQQEEETTRTTTFNSCHGQDESAPPLPPKPLAE
jgi:hypothetical protein